MRSEMLWKALQCRHSLPDGSVHWAQLPPWVGAVWEVGFTLATLPFSTQMVAVVSLPGKAFAAAFLAAGFAIERIKAGSFEKRFIDGDPVAIVHKGKRGPEACLARFLGHVEPGSGGGPPGVKLRRFEREEPCTWYRAGGVQLVRFTGRHRRLPATKPRTWELTPTDFASSLLGSDEESWIGARALVGFLGDHSTLDEDLTEDLRVVGRGTVPVDGSLVEILKDGNTERASSRSLQAVETLHEWGPALVVFDGGATFRKWRHRFATSHHAVILDRSSPSWEQDYEAVASMFHQRSSASASSWPSTTGTGIELLVFCP